MPGTDPGRSARVLGLIVLIAGVLLAVAGAATYFIVSTTLGDQRITVSDDADYFAGETVDQPWEAYAQANVIAQHAEEIGGGKTYAELPQDDPNRQTVMTASFLQASLFTAVLAFGVAVMAVGLGIVLVLIGLALRSVAHYPPSAAAYGSTVGRMRPGRSATGTGLGSSGAVRAYAARERLDFNARAEDVVRMAIFRQVVPILNVKDVAASIRYYEKLGFTESWTWEEPPTFGGVQQDGFEVHFCKDGQGSPGTWMAIWVDDVDRLHEDLATAGVDIRERPTTFAWGVREMNVADPDGHRIRFSTPTDQPADDAPLFEE